MQCSWSLNHRSLRARAVGTWALVVLFVASVLLLTACTTTTQSPTFTATTAPIPHFTYTGHSDAVLAVAWSPDGQRIASASQDNTVQVWDAPGG